MNEKNNTVISLNQSSRRCFVQKRNIIDSLRYIPISATIIDQKSIVSSNKNCCGQHEKLYQNVLVKDKNPLTIADDDVSTSHEFRLEVPKQSKSLETILRKKSSIVNDIMNNSWPISTERVENLIITNKRCQFSNEAISIKPITAVPGIGKKYGQILADHGFIYARQLLGYYMILKDKEMFRKWLEYKFHVPKFRASEVTSALDEIMRRTL